jgi:hypothetical protein
LGFLMPSIRTPPSLLGVSRKGGGMHHRSLDSLNQRFVDLMYDVV